MECKYEQALDMWYRLVELIDTLWNVNMLSLVLPNLLANELIDTLWNVNKI